MDVRYRALPGILLAILVGGSPLYAGTPTDGADAALPDLPPAPEDGVRLGLIADAQEGGDREPLRTAVGRFQASGVDVLLYGGDTTYGYSDLPPDWADALGPYGEESRVLFVYGNHDGGPGYAPYVPSEENATWWAARVEPATIIGLNTNHALYPESPQFEWLERTLAENGDGLVILMMHMPWWVPNWHHQGGPWFQGDAGAMNELVRKHDVDLVLAGHAHFYSRMERNGTTFLVSGPVDARVRDVPPVVSISSAFSAAERTATLLDVTADEVHGRTFDASGEMIDEFQVDASARAGATPPGPGGSDSPEESNPESEAAGSEGIEPLPFAGGALAGVTAMYLFRDRLPFKPPPQSTPPGDTHVK